jgi:predicted TIM-barrel fold metal-dependent hydrolase
MRTPLWRDEIGIERLLWGSDWPCTNFENLADYPTLFDALGVWLPDATDANSVLAGNPAALYWRD